MSTNLLGCYSPDRTDHLLRKEVLKLRWTGRHAEAAKLEEDYRRTGRMFGIPASRPKGAASVPSKSNEAPRPAVADLS